MGGPAAPPPPSRQNTHLCPLILTHAVAESALTSGIYDLRKDSAWLSGENRPCLIPWGGWAPGSLLSWRGAMQGWVEQDESKQEGGEAPPGFLTSEQGQSAPHSSQPHPSPSLVQSRGDF